MIDGLKGFFQKYNKLIDGILYLIFIVGSGVD